MDRALAEQVKKDVTEAMQPEGGLVVKLKQATQVYVDVITYTNLASIREIDFMQKLGGPACFMRIVTSQNSQMDFKNFSEHTNQNTPEWKRDPEGFTALIVRRYYDENIELIKFTPVAFPCIVRIWAERKGPQKEFIQG